MISDIGELIARVIGPFASAAAAITLAALICILAVAMAINVFQARLK